MSLGDFSFLFFSLTKILQNDSSSLPTDIQAESIPLILGGGDVLMVCLNMVG